MLETVSGTNQKRKGMTKERLAQIKDHVLGRSYSFESAQGETKRMVELPMMTALELIEALE